MQDPNSKHLGTTVWDASMVFAKFLVELFLHIFFLLVLKFMMLYVNCYYAINKMKVEKFAFILIPR